MGLAIQAPLDALLPTAEAPAGATPAPGSEGLFASLLASLSTAVEGEAQDLGLDPTVLPDGSDESDAEDDASDPFAALFALTVPLAAPLPQETVVVATATTAVEAATEAVAPTAQALGEPTSEAATPPTEAPEHTAEAAAQPVAEAAVVEQPAAATGAVQAAPAVADTEAPPIEAAIPEPPGSPPTGTPAAEVPQPPGTEPTSTSVVRNVGNAETENQRPGNGFGRRTADRPAPRASAQGIAHAAPNSAVGELRQAQAPAAAEAPAPADAPSAPAAELPQQVEQVATTVIETVEAGGGEARIHLDPVDLGEVTIHVHTDGDAVRVDVRAERHEAAQLLRDHTQDLSSLLGERGLNLSDVNVGLGRGNQGQGWGEANQRDNRVVPGKFASIFDGDEPGHVDTHNRLRAAYNPDGAHIYRV